MFLRSKYLPLEYVVNKNEMLQRVTPPKKINRLCNELGPDYSIGTFDCQYVINRDIDEKYNLQIMISVNTKYLFRCVVCVWDKRSLRLVNTTKTIRSITELKDKLSSIGNGQKQWS